MVSQPVGSSSAPRSRGPWFALVTVLAGGCAAPSSSDRPAVPLAETPPPEPAPPPKSQPRLQVAITVDDLPAHGPVPPGVDRLELHQRLLAAFEAHHVPRVYGFVNGRGVAEHEDRRAALDAWVAAGHPLGNHTFSHPRLQDVGLDAYLHDIAANEALLAGLMADAPVEPTFRYPFLLEGTDRASTLAIRAHLHSQGYRVAPATIDFYDWAFNPPYVRCLAQHDDAALQALRTTFVQHAWEMLHWSDAAAIQLYGRRIPQVLLLHGGAFDAEMIDPLLTMMEKQGVEWISLDQALQDPVYSQLPLQDGRNQGTLQEQEIDAGDRDHPPWNAHPDALLEVLCREPAVESH